MIVEDYRELKRLEASAQLSRRFRNSVSKVFMVAPEHYDIKYAINEFMVDKLGGLNRIDRLVALKQWENLKGKIEETGTAVQVLDPQPDLPDMVFCANQSFPFYDSDGKPNVILAHMKSEYRQPEVPFIESFYQALGFAIHKQSKLYPFEGNGDALVDPEYGLVWGGYGFRTDRMVYPFISDTTGWPVALLELKNRKYYHLDTCLSIVNSEIAVVYPEAFSDQALNMLSSRFKHLVKVSSEENEKHFFCNGFSPDGKNYIVQTGSGSGKANHARSKLEALGVHVLEVDTSEFMKSGGSVFCMKMHYQY